MAHDGFSLDDKRQPVAENDLPDILACWRKRSDPAFRTARSEALAGLEAQAAPLKSERLELRREINRLTFESVIAAQGEAAIHSELETAQARLAELESRIAPLQAQMEQLSRNFWVKRTEIVAAGYDLTASRYRQVAQDEAFYEQSGVTLERLLRLDGVMAEEIEDLKGLLA